MEINTPDYFSINKGNYTIFSIDALLYDQAKIDQY